MTGIRRRAAAGLLLAALCPLGAAAQTLVPTLSVPLGTTLAPVGSALGPVSSSLFSPSPLTGSLSLSLTPLVPVSLNPVSLTPAFRAAEPAVVPAFSVRQAPAVVGEVPGRRATVLEALPRAVAPALKTDAPAAERMGSLTAVYDGGRTLGAAEGSSIAVDDLVAPKPYRGSVRLKPSRASKKIGWDKGRKKAEKRLAEELERIRELHTRLVAGKQKGLLIVLQAMDTAGKDGVIKNVFSAFLPQGLEVSSFKKPTAEEAAHDFLWRIAQRAPGKGKVGVFNRSHYEDILVPSVFKTFPAGEIENRYGRINDFEADLAARGVKVIKIFLNISRDEQKERLQDRLDEPDKNWKFDPNDLEMRKHWDAFQKAYGKVLARTNTPGAPWYVVPADSKWYRDLAVAKIVRKTLERMDLEYPVPPEGLDRIEIPD